ncbi:rod shape-determining protein MreC [uncultured Ralstonia sp.]|jgi:rod shape-determining protein MreC|uniref:rod shape-determining protein MreC n=1 Tax=Ralstonia sp. TaxID=54061 RepID=UPI001EA59020|nr:rod shape-determining protein MreC [uncultured Ralstonia sp.]UCF25634.1 MAG: rod shape-determining protein MreC [Ralstonia sp.]
MNYSPPPLFKQGPSATARLVALVMLALALLVIDARLSVLGVVRQVVSVVLYPIERVVLIPRDTARALLEYTQSSTALATDNRNLRESAVAQAQQSLRASQLEAENRNLRTLLNLKQHAVVPTVAAEVLYEARDPYTQRIVIDRGTKDGVRAGYPVIDDRGVVGQVTRASLFESQVTLLTDKDQAIPVEVVRNGIRSVAFGGARPGALDLRFMAASADLQQGDLLVTSGLDGVYPAGLPVARIAQIERKADTAFSRVVCEPVAGIRSNRHLLIVKYDSGFPPPTDLAPPPAPKGKNAAREAREEKERAARAAAEANLPAPAADENTPPPRPTDADGNPLDTDPAPKR